MPTMDPQLLDLLVCPQCHGELRREEEGLACPACALVYPVEDGIPVMLVDQAKPLAGAALQEESGPASGHASGPATEAVPEAEAREFGGE
jgi:uncharacterized protein YbaR (Trm112 family)